MDEVKDAEGTRVREADAKDFQEILYFLESHYTEFFARCANFSNSLICVNGKKCTPCDIRKSMKAKHHIRAFFQIMLQYHDCYVIERMKEHKILGVLIWRLQTNSQFSSFIDKAHSDLHTDRIKKMITGIPDQSEYCSSWIKEVVNPTIDENMFFGVEGPYGAIRLYMQIIGVYIHPHPRKQKIRNANSLTLTRRLVEEAYYLSRHKYKIEMMCGLFHDLKRTEIFEHMGFKKVSVITPRVVVANLNLEEIWSMTVLARKMEPVRNLGIVE